MTAYIFCGPGTWECESSNKLIAPMGMTKVLTDQVPDKILGHEVKKLAIGYTAGYGDRASYLNSVNDLKNKLMGAIKLTPDDPNTLIFLVGYSQGATGCGDIARDILDGKFSIGKRQFLHYFGVSDPRRHRRDFLAGPPVGGCGITGERPHLRSTVPYVTQFCAPGDIIASDDPDKSLFPFIVPLTTRFWTGDTIQWVGYVSWLMSTRQWQDRIRKNFGGIVGFLDFRARLKYTLAVGGHYVASNVHTSYGQYEVTRGVSVAKYISIEIAESVNRT